MPDLSSIKNVLGSTDEAFEMTVLSSDGKERTLQLDKKSALVEGNRNIQEAATALNQYFTITDGQLAPRSGVSHRDVMHTLAKVDSVNTLTSGFTALFIQGNSVVKGAHTVSPEMADTLQAQFIIQMTQQMFGVAGDVKSFVSIVRAGLKEARHSKGLTLGETAAARSLRLSKGSGFTKALTYFDLALGGVSLAINAYVLSNATTAQEKAAFATNLTFDAGSLMLSGTAVLAQSIPATTVVGAKLAAVSPFILPVMVLFAGLSVGAGALAEAIGANLDEARHFGDGFNKEIAAYKNDGGYKIDSGGGGKGGAGAQQLVRSSETVKTLDLRNGKVEFSNPAAYRSSWRGGLHGYLPGMEPDIHRDNPINLKRVFNLPDEGDLPKGWEKAKVVQFPLLPKHTYSYSWNLLPSAEWRKKQRIRWISRTSKEW